MNYQPLLYLACLSIGMICNYHPLPFLKRNQLLMNLVRDREFFSDFRISSRMESQSAKNGVRSETVLDCHCCCFESKWRKRDSVSHQSIQGHCARPSLCNLGAPWCPWLQAAPPVKTLYMKVSGMQPVETWLPAGTAFTHLLRKLKEAFMLNESWLHWCLLSMYSSTFMSVGWNFRCFVDADQVRRQSQNLSKMDQYVLCHLEAESATQMFPNTFWWLEI